MYKEAATILEVIPDISPDCKVLVLCNREEWTQLKLTLESIHPSTFKYSKDTITFKEWYSANVIRLSEDADLEYYCGFCSEDITVYFSEDVPEAVSKFIRRMYWQ